MSFEAAGVAPGGQFLVENTHLEWRSFKLGNPRRTIDVGSMTGNWVLFYRPLNILANS